MKLLKLAVFFVAFALTTIPEVIVAKTSTVKIAERVSSRFFCGVDKGVPATIVDNGRGRVAVLIQWGQYFTSSSSSFNSAQRCQVVSERFQRYQDQGTLNYLVSGYVNGLPVVCVAQEKTDKCTAEKILLTLASGSDPEQVVRKLNDINTSRNSNPLEINDGLIVDEEIRLLLQQAYYYQKIEDYKNAETVWRKIIEMKLNVAYVYNELAFTLQKQGKLEDSIEYYQKTISIDPNFIAAINNLEIVQKELQIRQNPQIVAVGETKYLPIEQLTSTKRSIVRVFAKFQNGNMSGTGFVVKREGNKALILTNRHVIFDSLTEQESNQISIELYYGKPPFATPSIPARIVKRTELNDPKDLDLALLEVEGLPQDIKPLQISQGKIFNGTKISIIGHPSNRSWEVDKGLIQANLKDEVYIVEASLDIGSSGSPIFGNNNRIVAMVSQIQTIAGGNIVCYAHSMNTVIEILKTWGVEIP